LTDWHGWFERFVMGAPAANRRFCFVCAEHVQQLGGGSPLHILMEEK
jgi:hypothetical protein